MLKIFHFADLHLGLSFKRHEEAGSVLSEARYHTLKKLVELANDLEANLLVIAGDLFDRIRMKASEIQQAVNAINEFKGDKVLVLPGNHDYYSQDSPLWNSFSNNASSHVEILHQMQPYTLDDIGIQATIWPAPCFSKHSDTNTMQWVKESAKSEDHLHIGIAHGSIEKVSPDFENKYFPMTQHELKAAGMHIWLMGHTHITWPEMPDRNDMIFNPGTPEPDGFDCRHEGRAMLHVFDDTFNRETTVLHTGRYRFSEIEKQLNNQQDIEALFELFSDPKLRSHMLKLKVSGHLEQEAYDHWHTNKNQLREKVLELKLDDQSLALRLTQAQIQREFSKGSLPEMILTNFLDNEDELQMAYALLKEVQQ